MLLHSNVWFSIAYDFHFEFTNVTVLQHILVNILLELFSKHKHVLLSVVYHTIAHAHFVDITFLFESVTTICTNTGTKGTCA